MKGLLWHGALAVMGLFAAYSAYRGGDAGGRQGEEVSLVACEPERFQSLRLETHVRTVEVARRQDLGRDLLWVSTSERGAEDSKGRQSGFIGSKEAHALIEKVTPLQAIRSLGVLDASALEQAGLSRAGEPTKGGAPARLVLTCDGEAHVFLLGGTVFGRPERYLKSADDDTAWLLSSEVTRGLEAAETRLMQRELSAVDTTEVASAEVQAHSVRRVFLQRDRLRPSHAEWVDERAPEHRDESYGNWMTKFFRLRAQAYLAASALPPAPYEPVLDLVLRDPKGRALEEVTLVKGEPSEGDSVSTGQPTYYAKSRTTHGWVKLIPSQSEGFVAGWEAIAEAD